METKNTLKERFEKQYVGPTNMWKPKDITPSMILAFFRQELLALASIMENSQYGNVDADEAFKDAAQIIRFKADELV